MTLSALVCGKLKIQIVKNTHVNLVDLVDTRSTGQSVKVFKSVEALREYTIESGNYFPSENAHAGGVLKFLLRQILNPSPSGRGRGRPRRG